MQVLFGSTVSTSIIGIRLNLDLTLATSLRMSSYSPARSRKTSPASAKREHAEVIQAAELAGVHEMVQHYRTDMTLRSATGAKRFPAGNASGSVLREHCSESRQSSC